MSEAAKNIPLRDLDVRPGYVARPGIKRVLGSPIAGLDEMVRSLGSADAPTQMFTRYLKYDK